MDSLNLIQKIAFCAIPMIFAVTVHEAAHGLVAHRLGDPSAKNLGRLTLNPLKHFDWIGSILVPALCLTLGGLMFGWAKPVPVNERYFKNPKAGLAWVAIAGPFSNLLMAILWAMALIGLQRGLLGVHLPIEGASEFLMYMALSGIQMNLMLMLLNLIPIPPLDGSRVFSWLLPPRFQRAYEAIEPYGFLLVLLLVQSRVLSPIYRGLFQGFMETVMAIVSHKGF